MTREEAIEVMKAYKDAVKIEAFDVAIKALQESNGDLISRQDALASIKNLYPDIPIVDIFKARQKWLEKYAPYFECENAIEQLPSVKQTGQWIERRNRATRRIESVCSECGAEEGYPYNIYCGNCGAKMIFRPQEWSEQE